MRVFGAPGTTRIAAVGNIEPEDWWPDGSAWCAHGQTWIRVDGLAVAVPTGASTVDAGIADARWVATPEGVLDLGPRIRAGRDIRIERERRHGWSAPFALPRTARLSVSTRPFPRGIGVAWQADGIVCTATPEGIQARASWDGAWQIGPNGALALGDEDGWTHLAGPGRTPTPRLLPARLAWTAAGGVAKPSLPPASCRPVLFDHFLAGPDRRIWNLQSGQSAPLPTPGDVLGAAPGGCLVGDGRRFRWVSWSGHAGVEVTLPVTEPDTVDRLLWLEHELHAWTPLGRAWTVGMDGSVRVSHEPRPRRVRPSQADVEGISLRAEGVSGRWLWTRSGMLLERQSPSGSSYVR